MTEAVEIPNTIPSLEAAVLARLSARFADAVAVESFPDDPDAYRLDHPVGALLVRYHGAKYGQLLDTELVVQERTMVVEVMLVFRSLQGNAGIYEYLEAVRLALAGFQPPAFAKLRPLSDEFIDRDKGEWRYAIDFATHTTVIEDGDVDDAPLVQHITFNGASGNAEIQVPRAD